MFDLLQQEQAARNALFDYFQYKENWCVFPFEDCTEMYWGIPPGNRMVQYAETALELTDDGTGNYYQNEILHQRFLEKWVYRGEKYTMILVDTHTDGNKFLQIFDNAKEVTVKDET